MMRTLTEEGFFIVDMKESMPAASARRKGKDKLKISGLAASPGKSVSFLKQRPTETGLLE